MKRPKQLWRTQQCVLASQDRELASSGEPSTRHWTMQVNMDMASIIRAHVSCAVCFPAVIILQNVKMPYFAPHFAPHHLKANIKYPALVTQPRTAEAQCKSTINVTRLSLTNQHLKKDSFHHITRGVPAQGLTKMPEKRQGDKKKKKHVHMHRLRHTCKAPT